MRLKFIALASLTLLATPVQAESYLTGIAELYATCNHPQAWEEVVKVVQPNLDTFTEWNLKLNPVPDLSDEAARNAANLVTAIAYGQMLITKDASEKLTCVHVEPSWMIEQSQLLVAATRQ